MTSVRPRPAAHACPDRDDGLCADAVAQAAAVVRRGGIVAMPTETVYGLAANAFDANAVARVFEAKRRPRFDPLIVHVCAPRELERVASEVPPAAQRLVAKFWPGPLTLVLPKRPEIPDLVTSGLPTVAVRMPDHPLALALIQAAGVPLAAPSANPFGYISPTTAEHVRRQLGDRVDFILDGGPCRIGVESTILGWRDGVPTLLRAGGLAVEDLEHELGPIERSVSPDAALKPDAPGQLAQHYSPRTPMRLVARDTPPPDEGRYGWIGLQAPLEPRRYAAVEALSPAGDLREAAATLFVALHRLDALCLDGLHAGLVPDTGLGLAINDRLRRAASR
jgi:L-threonylcarbamoyladenylate synthase